MKTIYQKVELEQRAACFSPVRHIDLIKLAYGLCFSCDRSGCRRRCAWVCCWVEKQFYVMEVFNLWELDGALSSWAPWNFKMVYVLFRSWYFSMCPNSLLFFTRFYLKFITRSSFIIFWNTIIILHFLCTVTHFPFEICFVWNISFTVFHLFFAARSPD